MRQERQITTAETFCRDVQTVPSTCRSNALQSIITIRKERPVGLLETTETEESVLFAEMMLAVGCSGSYNETFLSQFTNDLPTLVDW